MPSTTRAKCALITSLALAACTHPADVSKPIAADSNVKAVVKDTPGGFTVDVRYKRYQFVPETSALLTTCRSAATSRAYEEAKNRGREIEPLNEQTIRVSAGRNGLLGLTSCRAFAEARFKN